MYGLDLMPRYCPGDWSVVAARAVVTRDVPPMTIVGDVPTKILKKISPKEEDRMMRRQIDVKPSYFFRHP